MHINRGNRKHLSTLFSSKHSIVHTTCEFYEICLKILFAIFPSTLTCSTLRLKESERKWGRADAIIFDQTAQKKRGHLVLHRITVSLSIIPPYLSSRIHQIKFFCVLYPLCIYTSLYSHLLTRLHFHIFLCFIFQVLLLVELAKRAKCG